MEWQRKHAALGLHFSQQAEEFAAQRAQAQDGSTDRLKEVQQELQATRKAVQEAEASAAKMRADAEESCNKWEQAYGEAERRCSELEALASVCRRNLSHSQNVSVLVHLPYKIHYAEYFLSRVSDLVYFLYNGNKTQRYYDYLEQKWNIKK
jgi:DNA repair exonuclease SbcCD ATPase subunit